MEKSYWHRTFLLFPYFFIYKALCGSNFFIQHTLFSLLLTYNSASFSRENFAITQEIFPAFSPSSPDYSKKSIKTKEF